MKKNLSILSLFVTLTLCLLVFASCEKANTSDTQLVEVQVKLSGINLASDITRATATEAKITNIALKVFSGSNVVETVNQATGDSGFGSISLRLLVGSYTFVAVANTKNSVATIASAADATIPTTDNVTVYTAVKEVSISGNSTQTVNIEMGKRKNTIFQVCITDATPTNVEKLQLIASPASAAASTLTFNPTTGVTPIQNRYEHTYIKSQIALKTFSYPDTFRVNFLLTAPEQNHDITINALSSSDEILFTRTLSSVTFRQGQSTTATGTFFSPITSDGFSFDTSITDNPISLD